MSTLANNESIMGFFLDLGIDAGISSPSLNALAATNNKYLRDLKLNVSTMLGSKNLSKKEAYLIALSIAANEKNETLIGAFERLAVREGAIAEEIAETHACVSIMNVNNVLYRFRHYMAGNEYYEKTPAGLRMSVMMGPVVGKEMFELMSLAVSAVNGCERCVTSHENSVKALGTSEPRIYDSIRLAAVIKGLCTAI